MRKINLSNKTLASDLFGISGIALQSLGLVVIMVNFLAKGYVYGAEDFASTLLKSKDNQ